MSKRILLLIFSIFLLLFITACNSNISSENPLIGTEATTFTLNNTDGGQTSLDDYSGTPVLLFFHMAVG
jgi:cytochrome oxidase Cu insertion factor (SCO1/SenC/PrrC family)